MSLDEPRELLFEIEKEQEMRNIVRIIGVSLVLMAGSLMVAGVAWAQAEETPITIRFICEDVGEPERFWVDEDGIEHGRDHLEDCTLRRDMVGTTLGLSSWDLDPDAGYYLSRGYYAFTGRILGGEMTTGVGRYTLEGNRINGVWYYTSDDIIHLAGGGLVKLSGDWRGGRLLVVSGVLLDPPGGAKRQGPRPRR
jgi:hypothetical protein